MSLPNPPDERPSEVPETDPLETPVGHAPTTPIPESETAFTPASRPSYEDQPAQSPYATAREFAPPPGTDPTSVIPPPPPSSPVPPPPYLQANPTAAPSLETPQFPQAAPMAPPPPPPAPYAPAAPAPSPYQPAGATPPVYTQEPYSTYQPYVQTQSASSNAIASLVCGILAWTLCGALTGLPAAILGFSEIKRIERGEANPSGKGMAQWGAWLGLVNCVGTVLLVLAYVFFFAAIIASAGAFS